MANYLIKKATLIDIDGQLVTSDARYHVNLLADYVLNTFARDSDHWIELREAANVMFHSGIVSNQQKIRLKHHLLFDELQNRGYILVVEPGSKAFKVWSGSESEKQYIYKKKEFWSNRRETSQKKEDFLINGLINQSAE